MELPRTFLLIFEFHFLADVSVFNLLDVHPREDWLLKWLLNEGKYSLTETIAPEGYALSTETVTFTVNEDGTTEPKNIVMQNKYIEVPKTALDTPQVLMVAFTAFAILGIGLVYLANKKQTNI